MPLSPHERRIALALAEAALPPGRFLPGGGPPTVERLEKFLERGGPVYLRALQAGFWGVESAALAQTGRPFTRLPAARRLALLERWGQSRAPRIRHLVRGVLLPLKMVHFDDPAMFAHVGCPYGKPLTGPGERRPWMRQAVDGRELTQDLQLSAEVVVVGTGAGGAAAAYELARRGRAVLMVEAGRYHDRRTFSGRPMDAFVEMYLARGATFNLGNFNGPVWAGRTVGGSTTVNSGTCFRAPERTITGWHRTDGLTELTVDTLDPYYRRVEAMLQVAPAERQFLGGVGRVIARGAEALKLEHGPLPRNAPGCDGQGVCCFGCPTGAKRSADVSWVPEAMKRGAQLLTSATVDHVTTRNGRACGVIGHTASGHTFRVEAEAVIVAGGTLMTPLLLKRSGLCQASGMLGRNLSIHPATRVMALFDEVIDMSTGIPQSYGIDSFAGDGLMFEGASTPLDATATAVPWIGPRFTDLMERYPHLATFGFMVKDTSRGRVFAGPGDTPLIRYDLNADDTARMQRGIEILSEVFLEAGASRVLPLLPGCDELTDRSGLEDLKRRKLGPGDFEIAAFHPLGTCRMGTDPRRSCVGPTGEAHDVEGLFVTDGSAIPSSLGVNPQMTIMALALRSAEALDARLARPSASLPTHSNGARDPMNAPHLEFQETMSGVWRRDGAKADRPFTFRLAARSEPLGRFARRREVHITGTVDAETLATAQPLEGTLGLDLLRTGTLPYAFSFTGDDGERYRFAGEKVVKLRSLLDSMTRLPGVIHDAEGNRLGEATVHFNLKGDLLSFLRSWRLA